jgi:hypothetical protein
MNLRTPGRSSHLNVRAPSVTLRHSLSRFWRFYLGLLLFAVSLGAPTRAADVKPELEFQPSSVSLAIGVGQQATALVVVHNPTNATLREVRLSWLPRPSLDIQPPSPLTLSVLAPHADYVWTLAIKLAHGLPTPAAPKPTAMAGNVATSPGTTILAGPPGPPETRIDESLDFLLQYKTPGGGREETQVVLKSLPVKTQELGDLDKTLDVQIKTALETLESSQTGSIYLVLKNNTARTINITGIAPIAKGDPFCPGGKTKSASASGQTDDDSLPFCFTSTFPPVTLSPYQTVIEELLVKARNRVKAGKYLLVLQITTQSYEGGVPLRRNVIVSQAMDVDVLGESAILKVAGIPAFFLLPGTLLLLTISLCWSLENRWWWKAPDPDKLPPELEYTKPTFWLVSVAISLAVAVSLLAADPKHRWYFTSYGLPDIAVTWFTSIVAGIVCYLIWWAVRDERRKRAEAEQQQKEHDEAARTFSETDKPLQVLERLQLRQQSLLRKRVQLKSETEAAFVLAGSATDATIWVCPAAGVAFANADAEKAFSGFTGDSPGAMLELLKTPGITVSWRDKPVDGVSLVSTKDNVERWIDADVFVQPE